ncbi:MAG: hypothetical protein H6591_10915 [Flavobacteriales bacterium]|nr:hypothetical protein [Flavobacteriales bacterium]
MEAPRALVLAASMSLAGIGVAQLDTDLLAQDEHYVMGDAGEDPSPELNAYEAFNIAVGGDSVRQCNGHPCTGWVEDHYPDGTLKHKGYYDQGHLTVYKNFHPGGGVERDFRSSDATRSTQRTWHPNGAIRSETRYRDGIVVYFEDHYVDGSLRYVEERHRKEPCFTRMELYDAQGKPVSMLHMVDKGALEVEQLEYHPGGALRSKGRARYNPARMDTQRVGTWVFFMPDGSKAREEDYIDGKVHAVR